VDPLLELFVLDVGDVPAWTFAGDGEAWGCALPLVDITAAGGFDQQTVIAGAGFPKVWENFDDIAKGALDLLSKLRDMFTEAWWIVWHGIGGAIRWLWDVVSYSFKVVYNSVTDVGEFIIDGIGDSITWLSNVVGDAAESVYRHIEDGVGWVRDRVEDAVAGLWQLVRYAVSAVAGRVEDLFDWTRDIIVFTVGNIAGRVEDLFTWVGTKVSDAAKWSVDNVVGPVFGFFQDIGGKFKDGFEAVGKKVLDAAQAIGEAVKDAFGWLFEHSLEPIADLLAKKLDIPGKLIRGEYRSMHEYMDDLLDPEQSVFQGLGITALAVTVFIPSLLLGLSPALAPINELFAQDMATVVGSTLLTRGDLQEARWRELDVDIEDQLARQGYDGRNRRAIAEIDRRIPGPADLVAMAVREAFSPEIAEKFGQYEDFPVPVEEYLAKQGYRPEDEWARRYWAAHWDLPSPAQGFEMLHRRVIDQEDLKLLLRALDVMPFWREKLVDISYNPLTRVDVRRMYKLGLMTEAQVYDANLDLGYKPEHARWLTEFTKKWATPESDGELKEMRDMSASTIRTGYRRGVVSRAEAVDYLGDAGFDPEVAEFLLNIDDVALGINPGLDRDVDVRELTSSVALKAYRERVWDRARTQKELEDMGYLTGTAALLIQLEDVQAQADVRELKVKMVRERYMGFELEDAAAASELKSLGIVPERQELLLLQWAGDRHGSNRRLTPAQVMQAAKAGLFTDDVALTYIISLGYTPDDATVYMGIQGRVLSESQLVNAWKRGVLAESDLLAGLERLGYEPEDARTVLEIAPTPLSQSQVVQAWRSGKLAETDALARLQQLGLTEEDARTVLGLAPLTVTSSQVVAAWRRGLLTDGAALTRLQEFGYPPADAAIIMGLAPLPLNVSQVVASWKAGLLEVDETLLRLELLGYAEDDAVLLLEAQTPAPAAA